MPRLPTRLILQAYQHDALLPLLLRECRTLNSAKNELRWLREHTLRVVEAAIFTRLQGRASVARFGRSLLRAMCVARSKGMPLQYILGDQPFGDLDIKCRTGVLIPRHDTEAITHHAAGLIIDKMAKDHDGRRGNEMPLRILDLCTGTGCIPLLLHCLLSPHFPKLSIIGIDISSVAVELARENNERNVRLGLLSERALSEVSFRQGNVLEYARGTPMLNNVLQDWSVTASSLSGPGCDVIISNPPYISPSDYRSGMTSRSVRIFEPKLALVPPECLPELLSHSEHFRIEDVFYHRIAAITARFKARLTVLECGCRSQAMRVAMLCKTALWKHSETSQATVDVWPVTGVDTHPYAVLIHMPINRREPHGSN
ncbi:S-adenosyl-L-methionine-dependent methyltransferase [Aspergillus heterothallicus]